MTNGKTINPTRLDSSTNGYRFTHVWEDDAEISTSVILAVARVTGDSPAEIPLLSESVDSEALNKLLRSLEGTDGSEVNFEFNGWNVVVKSSGVIDLERGSDGPTR